MPMLDGPGPDSVRVAPSFAVELMWALASALDAERRELSPLYRDIYQDDALLDRVRAFYDDRVGCFPEIVVLACLGGVLEEADVATTMRGIGRALEHRAGELRLASESNEDRRSIHARLESLHADAKRRRAYLALVEEIAAGIEPAWLADSSALIESRRLAAELDRGTSWRRILERECPKVAPFLEGLGPRFEPESVLIVPSPFSKPGAALLLDLPGVLVAGLSARRVELRDTDAHSELARRLKAVADPTRLSLLVRLAEGPSTVGDLAREFSLSQPTVSNHVKLLREAGLLEAPPSGRRRELAVDRGALEGLLGDLGAAIATTEHA